MSTVFLIKILGLLLVTMCCCIATYTDVKFQIIPNKLNLVTGFFGACLVISYYVLESRINSVIFYFVSIVLIFVISYFVWYLGIWAGGDVKLFTAISCCLIPDFLDIIPSFSVGVFVFPLNVGSILIPALAVMFNSLLSVIPLTTLYILLIIIKDKPYLIKRIDIKQVFNQGLISITSLLYSNIIINMLDIHSTYLKLPLLIILTIPIYKVINKKYIRPASIIIIFIYQVCNASIILFIEEYLVCTLIILIRNIIQKNIIKDALTNNIQVNEVKEGMILAYPLKSANNNYYFDKKSKLKSLITDNNEIICNTKAAGLTKEDMKIINELNKKSSIEKIPIKKAIPFAPFILSGLILTLLLGNTWIFMIRIMGMI